MRGQRLESKLYLNSIIYGPYFHSSFQRWYVSIFQNGRRVFLLLSRFKMQEHLGHILNEDQDVDHKDNNPLNDDILNLQVLTVPDHNRKTHLKIPNELDVICEYYIHNDKSSTI